MKKKVAEVIFTGFFNYVRTSGVNNREMKIKQRKISENYGAAIISNFFSSEDEHEETCVVYDIGRFEKQISEKIRKIFEVVDTNHGKKLKKDMGLLDLWEEGDVVFVRYSYGRKDIIKRYRTVTKNYYEMEAVE